MIRDHFNKNLIMYAEEEERFHSSNSYWICDKLFDVGDDKVRDHCHTTGKYRGASYWSCNINLKLSKIIPVIFHNLRGYDSYLTLRVIAKFDVKIRVIPKLVFIDSMQFMNSSLDSLVKKLSTSDFKYLPEEFIDDF